MEDSNAVHWHATAAYLYVLHLDGPALAWEYLRRNPEYRHDWRFRRGLPHTAARWRMRLLEDPERDARDAQPGWAPCADAVAQVCPDADPMPDAPPFRFWHLHGHKQLLHDGHHLRLTVRQPKHWIRLALAPMLEDGMAYAYAVRAGHRFSERWRAVGADLALLDVAQVADMAVARNRPGRDALLHMHTLQALDGMLADASQREVAEVLFGHAIVAEQWFDDSDLRARVRRLIRRGEAFMRGGYQRLLHIEAKGEGRSD